MRWQLAYSYRLELFERPRRSVDLSQPDSRKALLALAEVTVQGRETFWQGVVHLLLHSRQPAGFSPGCAMLRDAARRLRPDRALVGRSIQVLPAAALIQVHFCKRRL